MQVIPPQAPVLPNALPQEAVAKVVPQIAAQAGAPITQRAVDPSPKKEKGNSSKSNEERAKGGGNEGKQGHSVNIRV